MNAPTAQEIGDYIEAEVQPALYHALTKAAAKSLTYEDVLLELVWTLQHGERVPRAQLAATLLDAARSVISDAVFAAESTLLELLPGGILRDRPGPSLKSIRRSWLPCAVL